MKPLTGSTPVDSLLTDFPNQSCPSEPSSQQREWNQRCLEYCTRGAYQNTARPSLSFLPHWFHHHKSLATTIRHVRSQIETNRQPSLGGNDSAVSCAEVITDALLALRNELAGNTQMFEPVYIRNCCLLHLSVMKRRAVVVT
jgi:hypothetical protein